MQQEKQNQYSGDGRHNNQKKAEVEAADPINQNIETIADLHKNTYRQTDRHQRAIERVTAFLGRPRFLYIILAFVTLWILVNILLSKFGIPGFDPPPFGWLQGII